MPVLTTYLLRLDNEPTEALARFVERINAIELPSAKMPVVLPDLDASEESEP
jgi:hypothetical protein